MMKKYTLTEEERENIKYALVNRIEYCVYELHMNPLCDSIQVSIIALDSLGYEERAEEYRSLLPKWQDIYDRDAWDEEEWGE